MEFGFIRVAAAMPRVKVADVDANVEEICRMAEIAENEQVSILAFPELSVTGYSCGDLFAQELLVSRAEEGVKRLKTFSRGKSLTLVVGVPVRVRGSLYNCAAVIQNGSLKGIVPKIYLPTYNEFYESRWFSSGCDFLSDTLSAYGRIEDNAKDCSSPAAGAEISYAGHKVNVYPNMLFNVGRATFAIEICEDLWTPIPPSSHHALAGAQIIVNLSASNEVLMKHQYRKQLVSQQSARTISAYVYSSCGYGESTQDVVYAGSSLIYENGSLMAENKRFSLESGMICADIDIDKLSVLRQKESTFHSVAPDGTGDGMDALRYFAVASGNGAATDFEKCLRRHIDPHPFVPGNAAERDERCREITDIQVIGLATRLAHIHSQTAVIGISGGLDSTLALIVTVLAFDKLGWDRKRIIGITMPGLGTTTRTHSNASDLMAALGVTSLEIPIGKAVAQHFSDIGQNPEVQDVTYENSQARERTQILMDVANKENGIVVGTGDLSELALGWATYNGDHMSMYAVNASIPKTLVRYLVGWAAENHFESDVAVAAGHGAVGACGGIVGAAGDESACGGVEDRGTLLETSRGDSSGRKRSVREILMDIIDTPVSPELKPADSEGNITQKTEDLVGPYELHDFFLYHIFRFGARPSKVYFLARKAFEGVYDDATILKWLNTFIRRFFAQQFKRSCLPDCPKVGSVSLSPRGDWRMPSDAWRTIFLNDLPER
jgi:NAD+ synthase (glutamine-hydrolysing)